jgi:hypothetical protein
METKYDILQALRCEFVVMHFALEQLIQQNLVTLIKENLLITYHWELKESCGGIPYRMIALRKAFLWRALKPRT